MMIMRFHRLIQSKLIWLIFLGIIVVTFVFWGAASVGAERDPRIARMKETVGSIGGETVSLWDLERIKQLMRMNSNQNIPDDALDEMAWSRLILLRSAEDLGVWVPEELARQQMALMFSGADGKIDQDRYTNFRQQLSRQLLTEQDYQEFLHNEMRLQRLEQLLSSYSVPSPFLAERLAARMTDRFEISVVTLDNSQLPEIADPTEEELQSYFSENKDRFPFPEQRVAKYIPLPVASYLEEVEPPSDEEALAYYQANADRYQRDKALPEDAEEDATPEKEAIPFEDVKSEIVRLLQLEKAQTWAEEQAVTYVVSMTPRRGRSHKSLEDIAAESGQSIQTTPPFSRRDLPSGVIRARQLVQTVYDLDESELGRLADPIVTPDTIYIVVLDQIIPSRPASLEEVQDDVKQALLAERRQEAMNSFAEKTKSSLQEKLDAGERFADAASSLELSVKTPPAFQMNEANPMMMGVGMALMQRLPEANPGELIGPEANFFGATELAYVLARSPQPAVAAEVLPQMEQTLEQNFSFQGIVTRFLEQQKEALLVKEESQEKQLEESSDS